ncbi:MAG: right-handed parallel beta-helix repeat-containing protein [Phycisphaerales bacterium]|nr:right-handed parallel beta-helix repeat-containing protein [Phycisphaerales bacterium]
MNRQLASAGILVFFCPSAFSLSIPQESATVQLKSDGQKIISSVKVAAGRYEIPDAGDDGAIQIAGEGITVDFGGAELVGAKDGADPDQFSGKGVVLTGRKITLKNLKVRGYKVGVYAHDCDGLTVEDVDISGNYQKRLLSTPQREDGSDWLYPHHNDGHEWMNNYGAGLYVEKATDATIRRVRARHGQNGIILDRVSKSEVYDNDCSFLSGWGLAMWRSSGNVIAHNAFDFCIRGYSHGVYNRGQDSAGILMFEQNSDNLIAENSCTHGGDGFFGFAGREALGEDWWDKEAEKQRQRTGHTDVDKLITVPPDVAEAHKRKGNNHNILFANDFSYAAAHGIEMTFSFGNQFVGNRLVNNAICGVWGGYSQDTIIEDNTIESNGEMAYGAERGGINIEHGRGNRILRNRFKDNKAGVYLWDDDDGRLLKMPWAIANHAGSRDNFIALNTFENDGVAMQLRKTHETTFADNQKTGAGDVLENVECTGLKFISPDALPPQAAFSLPPLPGDARPVGARPHLQGRQNIVMTEWGPYDFEQIVVAPSTVAGADQVAFQVLGPKGRFSVAAIQGDVNVSPKEGDLPGRIAVSAAKEGLLAFELKIDVKSDATQKTLTASGTLFNAKWTAKFYKWDAASDPRDSEEHWKKITAVDPVETQTLPGIDFKWGGGGVSEKVGADHFATVAQTKVNLPKSPTGKWRVRTVSDDGVRVFIDGKQVLANWTWHGPTEDTAEVELPPGEHEIKVEHFEIDGWAVLQVRLEPVN